MTEKGNELALRPEGAMTVQQVQAQIATIQELMQGAMKDGQHYGTIPGCGDKPTLLKPGAEKLSMMFRLTPSYEIKQTDHDEGHREYYITCKLTHITSGNLVGMGVGSCSTMESKYRYRQAPAEVTSNPVPQSYWDLRKSDPKKAQQLIGGPGFGTKKVDGMWMITKAAGKKIENPDLADVYNTVLKMAKKRAHVDAILTATAASDIFTQDIEDFSDVASELHKEIDNAKKKTTQPAAESKPPAKKRTTKKTTTPAAPPVTSAEAEARANASGGDFPDVEEPSAPTEPPTQEGEVYEFLNDETKEKIIKNFEKFNVKQSLIESVLGISINGWHEGHKEFLLNQYHALNDGALDTAGFAALNYGG